LLGRWALGATHRSQTGGSSRSSDQHRSSCASQRSVPERRWLAVRCQSQDAAWPSMQAPAGALWAVVGVTLVPEIPPVASLPRASPSPRRRGFHRHMPTFVTCAHTPLHCHWYTAHRATSDGWPEGRLSDPSAGCHASDTVRQSGPSSLAGPLPQSLIARLAISRTRATTAWPAEPRLSNSAAGVAVQAFEQGAKPSIHRRALHLR
jgi:hypothetical protein